MSRPGLMAVLLASVCVGPATAQPVTRSDLKPGLVFTVTDAPDAPAGRPRTVTRIEPIVGLTLGPKEAAHPRSSGGAQFTWRGYLNVVQPGLYRFDATLSGAVEAAVGDQTVLKAARDGEAALQQGNEVRLAAGIQPFQVTLRRTGPEARLELLWRGPAFRTEPIPYFFFGHLPKQRPESFASDLARDHGRFLFEELSCARCHKPGPGDTATKTLTERTGPNLTEVGRRADAGWLDAWLADPHKLRPNTAMPAMFTTDDRGRAERYAVVAYLTSLAGPPPEPKAVSNGDYGRSVGNGQKLYLTTGCAACHGDKITQPPAQKKADDEDDGKPELKPEDSAYALGTSGPGGLYLLGAVGSKFTVPSLTRYLTNPLATNPHGRMPSLVLSNQEAQDLARFLCKQTDDAIPRGMPAVPKTKPDELLTAGEATTMAKLQPAQQWREVGKRLLTSKGCVNCHAVEPNGAPLPVTTAAVPKLTALPEAADHGCLAGEPAAGRVPVYHLDATQRAALTAFVSSGLNTPDAAAPAYQAKVALRRFNCLNCHNRDGEGGIPADLADRMKALENAANADDVAPPRLTGVGHKLRSSWFRQVLTAAARARPWMSLRMPQYGEAAVGFLPDAVPKLEGAVADDRVVKADLTAAKVEAGRTLAGKNGHGCITCHDISGITGGGTRGPDLALTDRRVRHDWYLRWMHLPQRIAPGTRMPQVAIDGKALLTSVFDGDADRQFDALWAYLTLGPGLPLPAGMEPPKGLVVAVKDRPELLRTFMPDGAGTKAIAVGFPGGVNTVFDAATCRLGYAWSGNFLDASPVWDGRGGNPAKLLGPKFWTGPASFPWAVTDGALPPDFAKRATDPAYGHPLPNDAAYAGPRFVHFAGYALDGGGVPTFRYVLTNTGGGPELTVHERTDPLPVSVAAGVRRTLTVDAAAGKTTWFLAGETPREPRLTAGERNVALDLKVAEPGAPAVGSRLVLPADGDRATVVDVAAAPEGTTWRFVPRPNGGWFAFLRLPPGVRQATVTLNVWGVPRDDEALFRGLRTK